VLATASGPTDADTDQTDAISAPIASILVRHLPMHLLGKDWRDGARAAGATRDYITDGRS